MKYDLLSRSCLTQINFDIEKITGFVHPLQLHPFTISHSQIRIQSRHRRTFTTIRYQVNGIRRVIRQRVGLAYGICLTILPNALRSRIAETPGTSFFLPSYRTHKVCEFLNAMIRAVFEYYGPVGVRILPLMSHVKEGEHMEQKHQMATCPLFDNTR